MAEEMSWTPEAIGVAGPVVVEVLTGVRGRVLSVATPGWSLTFRIPDGGVAALAAFLRANTGRAEFAECMAGSFCECPVRVINDDEYADRLWLRVFGDGQLADFPLVGEAVGWFVAAVAKAASVGWV